MPTNRRNFIRQTATLLGGLALHQNIATAFPSVLTPVAEEGPDDDFWLQIRQAYAASPNIINLNNGGVSPSPRATLDALDYYNRMCSEAPSYYMWRVMEQAREPLRENLAQLAGVSSEEIAINRNATEALSTVVFGLPLQAGDEVVLSKYDYPHLMNAWKQREQRDGIKLVWVELDLPSENADYLVQAYTSKFSARTRIVHLTHVINWNGQILPVRAIADQARARGIEVLVDGAHSFALLDYRIPELGCDYWGTSLHKWLCGPYGSGMLWIKKEKIAGLWPLFSPELPHSDNIRKFESLGTRSFPIEMAIGYSLDLHNLIGTRRKRERLFYLKNYWMEGVRDVPGIRLQTSPQQDWGCAIGTFGLEGQKASEISGKLYDRYKIHTTSIEWEKINSVRVTPNVYTTTGELDRLVEAVKKVATG